MSDIYNQHVKFGVDYFKENLSSFPDILGFGNTLFTSMHYDLLLSLCEFGFDKVNHHEARRGEMETRNKQLNLRERKLEEDKQARKATVFNGEEQAEVDTIKATRSFLANLHPNLRLPESEVRKFNVDLANLMIKAALAESAVSHSDDTLIKTVKQCSQQQKSAEDVQKLSKNLPPVRWSLILGLNEDTASRISKEEPEHRAQADQLEELRLSAVMHSLNTIYDRLSYYSTTVAADKPLTEAEKHDYERLQTGEVIEEILDYWIPLHIKVPDNLIKIAGLLLNKKNPEFVLNLGTQLATRLVELEQQQDEREVLRTKLNALKAKVEKFKIELKPVPKELQTEFNTAEEALVFEKFLPSYMFGNVPVKTDSQRLQMDKICISAILELRASTKGAFDNELKAILDHSKNPKNLHSLADHLLSLKETELAINFGEKCQHLIQEVESQRETRVPLEQSLKQLQAEEDKLNAQNKHLSQEKKDEIVELKEQIAKLPKWPKFADLFDYHQYDDLNLEVVKTMVSAISAKKEFVYKKGSAKEKEAVGEQVKSIVDLCLEKFTDPHMQSCKQPEIVLQVLERVFTQSKNIDKMRDERLKLQRSIDKTKKEEQTKVDKKKETKQSSEKLKKLEESLANLPKWPHYAELDDVTQFDKTKFDAAVLLVTEALAIRSNLEASIKKKHFENPESIDIEKEEEQRKQANTRIQSAIRLCLANLKNPSDLYTLAKSLKNDVISALEVALHSHQSADTIQEKRATDEVQQTLDVLLEEKAELNKIKKDLPIEDLKTVEELQAALAVPTKDKTNLKELDQIHNQVGRFGITTAYDSKVELLKKIANKDFDAKQAERITKEDIPATTQKAFDLCRDFVNDPKTLIEIAEDLGARYKEFERALEVGHLCFDRMENLREQNKERAVKVRERQALLAEKQQLDKLRRKLSAEQAAKLRELEVEDRLAKLQPSYYTETLENYDSWCLDVSKIMITNSIKLETNYAASLTELDELPPASVVAQAKKKLSDATNEVLEKCLGQITSVPNLLAFATYLDEAKEYLHVVTVGTPSKDIENILDSMRLQQEKYENKQGELKKLEQQFLLQKDESEKKKIEASIQKKKKEIAKLEKTVRSYEEISELTLQVTAIMIKAATAEDLGEVLRDQTILAFKVDNTPERWDQVRALCSEEEWETTKNELVGFVMKRDENITAKIELLLKDGLYEQCITIFPRPSVSEDSEELDKQIGLLHKLYTDVDRHAIQHLDKLNNVVQRYAKRCFQLWEAEKMSEILDILQRRYPEMIVTLYTTACDNLLLNILPSQYSSFINIIKDLQSRLVSLGLSDVWTKFMIEFKKKHRSKNRLIQMLNLIGDSGWSLEEMIKSEEKSSNKGKRKLDAIKKEPAKSVKIPSAPAPTFTSTSSTPKTMANFFVSKVESDSDDSDDDNNNNNNNNSDSDSSSEEEVKVKKMKTEKTPSKKADIKPVKTPSKKAAVEKKEAKKVAKTPLTPLKKDVKEKEDKKEKKESKAPAKKILDDDDEEEEEEDDKLVKKSARKVISKRKAKEVSEDEEEVKKPKKKVKPATASKKIEEDEEENEENEDKEVEKEEDKESDDGEDEEEAGSSSSDSD